MRFTRHTGMHTRVRHAIRVSGTPAAHTESDFPLHGETLPHAGVSVPSAAARPHGSPRVIAYGKHVFVGDKKMANVETS